MVQFQALDLEEAVKAMLCHVLTQCCLSIIMWLSRTMTRLSNKWMSAVKDELWILIWCVDKSGNRNQVIGNCHVGEAWLSLVWTSLFTIHFFDSITIWQKSVSREHAWSGWKPNYLAWKLMTMQRKELRLLGTYDLPRIQSVTNCMQITAGCILA